MKSVDFTPIIRSLKNVGEKLNVAFAFRHLSNRIPSDLNKECGIQQKPAAVRKYSKYGSFEQWYKHWFLCVTHIFIYLRIFSHRSLGHVRVFSASVICTSKIAYKNTAHVLILQ